LLVVWVRSSTDNITFVKTYSSTRISPNQRQSSNTTNDAVGGPSKTQNTLVKITLQLPVILLSSSTAMHKCPTTLMEGDPSIVDDNILSNLVKSVPYLPSLCVLNAAALTKPFAIEHLTADLIGNHSDVAVTTETHLKSRHADAAFSIDGYTQYDGVIAREGARGGGVAVYIGSELQSAEWMYTADERSFEILWVHVGSVFIAAIYHPPKAQYVTERLLQLPILNPALKLSMKITQCRTSSLFV
jgi:hypothetical protein